MHASFASLILAALAVSPAIAAPFSPVGPDGHRVILPRNVNVNQNGPHFILPRNANINKDGPHFILPRQGGPANGVISTNSHIELPELPLNFRPLGPAVGATKREPVQPVSFIPVGAALGNSAPADTASTGAEAVASPAPSSTGAPTGVRPVSFIPVGAALGGNAKREPVQSPPIVAPGRFPPGGTTTGSAPAASQSAPTGVRPVSFIPVNALEGDDSTNAKRASTIHSVSFIPVDALKGNEKRIVDPVNPLPVDSPIDYAGAQKREPIRGPVSFIPVSALSGAQRQAKRQEAAIPPAGSAPGTVPADVRYPAGESNGPMMYIFREDGSVVAMPAASGTV